MISPPNLKPGDTAMILSTARKIDRASIDSAQAIIESWGLKVEFGKHLFAEHHQYAGTDEMRLSDLQHALDREDIKAIFCARGGYGTVRLIDQLDFSKFKELPKWLIGYSDVTVLHTHLQQVVQRESLHASMPINFKTNTKRSLENIKTALWGENLSYAFGTHALNRSGRCSGEVIGGNLSILYSLNGTISFPDMTGRILFLEDLDEYLYHIDRMMMNLKRSGALNSLAGLIIGGMSDMNDNPIPFGKPAPEIISEAVADYNYPVAFGFPAGHLDDNNPLIMGRKARLNVDQDESILEFEN